MAGTHHIHVGHRTGSPHNPGSTSPIQPTGCKYSMKDLLALKAVFESHDKDGTGEVSVRELVNSINKNSPNFTGKGLEAFRVLDKNGHGKLTFIEYMDAVYPLATPAERKIMAQWAGLRLQNKDQSTRMPSEVDAEKAAAAAAAAEEKLHELRMTFRALDRDGDGLLRRREMAGAAADLGMDARMLMDLFDDVDEARKEAINFDQFCRMLGEHTLLQPPPEQQQQQQQQQ